MPALELDAIEARILGVLIEKELTTPEQYPLSLNALAAGCNQKSNRDPVVELSDSEIAGGIERLRRKSLVGASHAAGSRTERYKHAAGTVWTLAQPEIAILAELLLRGAQQPGELRARADRMSRFETLEALGQTLEALRQRGFVRRLEPLPGSRAPQWEQIVAATSEPRARSSALSPAPSAASPEPAHSLGERGESPVRPASSLESRVAALEAEVARLARLYDEQARAR